MGRCEHCPVTDGPCRAQVDPSYGVLCDLASGGEPSQVAAVRAASLPGPLAPAPPPPPRPSPIFGAEVRRALWLGRLDCWYAGPPDCGCDGSHKCHHLGRDARLDDCASCLGPRG